jgi:hypothetical protein
VYILKIKYPSDRYQVKSAPGHFGTYLHSQIGTYSNQHLVNSAPVMVYSAPLLKQILSQNNDDGLGVGLIVFPSTL